MVHGDIPLTPATMISSVTCEVVQSDTLLSPGSCVSNLISPVLFDDIVKNLLLRSGQRVRKKLDLSQRSYLHISVLVEIGPHSALQGPINDISDDVRGTAKIAYTSILIRNNSSMSSLLNATGQMRCLGYPIKTG